MNQYCEHLYFCLSDKCVYLSVLYVFTIVKQSKGTEPLWSKNVSNQ